MSEEIDLRGSLEGVTFLTPLYVLSVERTPEKLSVKILSTTVRGVYGAEPKYDAQTPGTCIWVPCAQFSGQSAATVYIKEDDPEAIEKVSELVLNLCYAMRKGFV